MRVIFMYITKPYFLLVACSLISNRQFNAQCSTRMGLNLNKSFSKHFDLEAGYQYRIKNSSEFDNSNIDFKWCQHWMNGIETFLKYRNSFENNKDSDLNSKIHAFNNRIGFGLNISFLRLFDISKRRKIDWTITQQYDNNQFRRNSSILRNKLTLKYDIKDFILSPFISFEHFYKWNRDIVYASDEITIMSGSRSWRMFAGIEIETSKKSSLRVATGLNKRIDTGNQQWIINAEYSINLD